MALAIADGRLKHYKILEKLGKGNYGVVYKVLNMKTSALRALKKFKQPDDYAEGISATTLREVSLLKRLKHPCIVELYESLFIDGNLSLVFELMQHDLRKYLDSLESRNLSLTELKRLSYRMIEGVRMCHANRILHRDLKPQNLLVDSKGTTLKLADFGLGREHGLPIGKLTHEVVTLWYRPPEILLGQDTYSGACDMWAVGCIIPEMATKQVMFPGDSEIGQTFKIMIMLGTPKDCVWPGVTKLPDYCSTFPKWEARDLANVIRNENTGLRFHDEQKETEIDDAGIHLVSKMLCYSPANRISAKEALRDPWFDDIREEMDDIMQSEQNALIRMHSESSLRLNEAASIVGSRAGWDLSSSVQKHLERLSSMDRVLTHENIHDYWASIDYFPLTSSVAGAASSASSSDNPSNHSSGNHSWRAGTKRRRVAMDVE